MYCTCARWVDTQLLDLHVNEYHCVVILQNPALSSAGGGLQPSVLASAEPSSLQGSNMAALFSQHSSAQPVSCVCGWISPRAATTFALASPSGSIHLIHLPSPQDHGILLSIHVH